MKFEKTNKGGPLFYFLKFEKEQNTKFLFFYAEHIIKYHFDNF